VSTVDEIRPFAPDELRGRRALVTGSSRGIGADTVAYLADAGADVVVNYRNKAARSSSRAARRPSRSARTSPTRSPSTA
jgi:3-oxoacyl-[acyl-carrier protein] reductase